MDIYIYRADCLCSDCGEIKRAELAAQGKAPEDVGNESTYDSDDFPIGPYANGGGEADTPQHCGTCGVFLENPLTPDGSAYVKRAFKAYAESGQGSRAVLETWQTAYNEEYGEAVAENEREGLPAIPDFWAGNGVE